jgi:hypothetical protein
MADNQAADRGDALDQAAAAAANTEDDAARVEADVAAATPDPAAPAEPEGEAARDEKGRFIPKQRFDEAVGRERDARESAERRLADLQAQMAQVNQDLDVGKVEGEIQELEKAHTRAMMDGDSDKSAELMGQIRLKERSISLQQATHLSREARTQAAEEVRMDMAISTLETTYSVLNPQAEDFDPDIVDMVVATQRALIERDKLTPSQAMIKAAQKVVSKLTPVAAAGEQAGLAAGKTTTDRKGEQVAKNLDAAKRQPASTKDTGLDSTAAGIKGDIDPTKLSYDELKALPEATKARLRGDML